jgi:hypothetical protein
VTNPSLRRVALSVLFAGLLLAPLAPAAAQWVFVARKAAQRVNHMALEAEGPNGMRHDFATVLLEAPADKVYATVLSQAQKNRQVRILMTDPGARRIQVAEGDRVATIHVAEFSPDVSQLMIAGTAGPREDSTSSRVVAAVMRVCAEMKKECQVER